ncbi:hypothetical protein C8J57DRAFT_238953 [Mycena rebaudengoi]|nr:hypothetical protein C8J57DRAFT_238953 [Mycena rebaudengoi]
MATESSFPLPDITPASFLFGVLAGVLCSVVCYNVPTVLHFAITFFHHASRIAALAVIAVIAFLAFLLLVILRFMNTSKSGTRDEVVTSLHAGYWSSPLDLALAARMAAHNVVASEAMAALDAAIQAGQDATSAEAYPVLAFLIMLQLINAGRSADLSTSLVEKPAHFVDDTDDEVFPGVYGDHIASLSIEYWGFLVILLAAFQFVFLFRIAFLSSDAIASAFKWSCSTFKNELQNESPVSEITTVASSSATTLVGEEDKEPSSDVSLNVPRSSTSSALSTDAVTSQVAVAPAAAVCPATPVGARGNQWKPSRIPPPFWAPGGCATRITAPIPMDESLPGVVPPTPVSAPTTVRAHQFAAAPPFWAPGGCVTRITAPPPNESAPKVSLSAPRLAPSTAPARPSAAVPTPARAFGPSSVAYAGPFAAAPMPARMFTSSTPGTASPTAYTRSLCTTAPALAATQMPTSTQTPTSRFAPPAYPALNSRAVPFFAPPPPYAPNSFASPSSARV